MSIKTLFDQEVQQALSSGEQQPEGVFSREELEKLPELLGQFILASGYLGKPKADKVYLTFDHTEIKLKPGGKWMGLTCRQFNCVSPPTRLALMQTHFFGFIPFGARDKYQNGRGNMRIQLAGCTLSNAQGWQMNQAGLVTFLAETILLPAALLQPNMTFQAVAANQVRASISDAGMQVSGDFIFNNHHQITAFTTQDRYFSKNGREYQHWRWSALFDRYRIINGVSIPTVIRAVWHMPQGQDYAYFRAAIKEVAYG